MGSADPLRVRLRVFQKGGHERAAVGHPRLGGVLPPRSSAGRSSTPRTRNSPNERRVRVAVGRDYDDVSPTRGVFVGNSDSILEVSVRMRPIQ